MTQVGFNKEHVRFKQQTETVRSSQPTETSLSKNFEKSHDNEEREISLL